MGKMVYVPEPPKQEEISNWFRKLEKLAFAVDYRATEVAFQKAFESLVYDLSVQGNGAENYTKTKTKVQLEIIKKIESARGFKKYCANNYEEMCRR